MSLNFLHQKQIIQETNNLLIILIVSTFYFIQFNEGASNLLHYKQIIQEANNLFIIINANNLFSSYFQCVIFIIFWELGAVASNGCYHRNIAVMLPVNIYRLAYGKV
jgi:hypothetical protein